MLFFLVSCPPTIRALEEGRSPQELGDGGLPVGGNGGAGGSDGVWGGLNWQKNNSRLVAVHFDASTEFDLLLRASICTFEIIVLG